MPNNQLNDVLATCPPPPPTPSVRPPLPPPPHTHPQVSCQYSEHARSKFAPTKVLKEKTQNKPINQNPKQTLDGSIFQHQPSWASSDQHGFLCSGRGRFPAVWSGERSEHHETLGRPRPPDSNGAATVC